MKNDMGSSFIRSRGLCPDSVFITFNTRTCCKQVALSSTSQLNTQVPCRLPIVHTRVVTNACLDEMSCRKQAARLGGSLAPEGGNRGSLSSRFRPIPELMSRTTSPLTKVGGMDLFTHGNRVSQGFVWALRAYDFAFVGCRGAWRCSRSSYGMPRICRMVRSNFLRRRL